MTIEELKNKRIAVLGLGVNNTALVNWLIKQRVADITICDQNPTLKLDRPEWANRVNWRLGPGYLNHLSDFSLIIRTPGIPYLLPELQKAKSTGSILSSQTKLFFDLSPARIIGVTGTKGKGTTSTLIAEILSAEKKRISKYRNIEISKLGNVFLAGNIGKDPFEFLSELKPNDWVILELSSYQLQDLDRSPEIAVVLDITSDHLDYHKTIDEYVLSKANIVRFQKPGDKAILNLDSATALSFGEMTDAMLWYFSRRKTVDMGVYVRWVKGRGARWGELVLRTEKQTEIPIVRSYDLAIRGEHNLENIAAAIVASYLAGADPHKMERVIAKYKGLPHRIELVGKVDGRLYYNDSIATTPESTIAAIRSFHEPIHLIVGGSSKGADFSELVQVIAESTVKTIIPLGKAEGMRIAKALSAIQMSNKAVLEPVSDMDEAVGKATRVSEAGDVILLSPAAASFDLFGNYKERGEAFRHAVMVRNK